METPKLISDRVEIRVPITKDGQAPVIEIRYGEEWQIPGFEDYRFATIPAHHHNPPSVNAILLVEMSTGSWVNGGDTAAEAAMNGMNIMNKHGRKKFVERIEAIRRKQSENPAT